VRKPGRMALAHLEAAGMEWEADLPGVEAFCAEDRHAIHSQIKLHLNTPLTSSMGRLFDAASALLGVRQTATYEGQAAIELEALAAKDERRTYPIGVEGGIIDPAPLWEALIADWRAGTDLPRLSARFHNSIAELVLELGRRLRSETGCRTAALSGGVWQNVTLLGKTLAQLRAAGFTVYVHRLVPPNDGGIALGQAVVAAHTANA